MMEMRLEMRPNGQLMANRGLVENGRVQAFIDSECIRLMRPYTPRLNGKMEDSATLGTSIGSGKIRQIAPYARYQYYGKLMVSTVTGSSYAKSGESKRLTGVDLVHQKSKHPQAGPFWFERMKADHCERILRGARMISERR